MPDYETIRFERPRESIALITLDRPERLNAISFPMFDELHDAIGELSRDRSARVVVITGAGRGFCAGLDLDAAEELATMSAPELTERQEYWGSLVARIRALPQPAIAAVNGAAAGGGLSLALAADIRIATTAARFNAAFVRIGLTAGDLGVSWALPRTIGLGRAAELMYTGRFVEADEALEIGLVNRVVPGSEELLPASFELAEQIAANSYYGVRLSKRVLQTNVDAQSLESALELENRGQVLATRGADMVEALRAFREKREPRFEGR